MSDPTMWAISFTAQGTVGKGTGPDPDTLEKESE